MYAKELALVRAALMALTYGVYNKTAFRESLGIQPSIFSRVLRTTMEEDTYENTIVVAQKFIVVSTKRKGK